MPPEPAIKRAVAFVDGQNLFFAARQAFGYTYPNYDPLCRHDHHDDEAGCARSPEH